MTDEDGYYEPVYRDGRLYVMADRCDSCIFRPGNPMRLAPGRVRGMVTDCRAEGVIIPCHQTTYGQAEAGPAICRGFYDSHGGAIPLLRLARLMDIITEQSTTTKEQQ